MRLKMNIAAFAALVLLVFPLPPSHAQSIESDKVSVRVVYEPNQYGNGEEAETELLWKHVVMDDIPTTGAFVAANTGREYGLVFRNKTSEYIFVCPSIDGLLVASHTGTRRQPSHSELHDFKNWISPAGKNDPGCRGIRPHETILIRQHYNQRALKFVPGDESRAQQLENNDFFGRYYNMPIGTITIAVFVGYPERPLSGGRAKSLDQRSTGTGSGGYVGDRTDRGSEYTSDEIAELIIIRYEDVEGEFFDAMRTGERTYAKRHMTR